MMGHYFAIYYYYYYYYYLFTYIAQNYISFYALYIIQ